MKTYLPTGGGGARGFARFGISLTKSHGVSASRLYRMVKRPERRAPSAAATPLLVTQASHLCISDRRTRVDFFAETHRRAVCAATWLAKFLSVIFFIAALLISTHAAETKFWHPAPSPLLTRWAAAVSPTNVWPEYPRPQLVRADWKNLNGLWDYALTDAATSHPPVFDGKILVPFPVESALSGVMTNLSEHGQLWYRRSFSVPPHWRGQRVRLHFGAVDWRCQVRVNGRDIGQHQGGYDAFTFDITDALRWNGSEEISVCVTDPTEGDQPRGKQSRKPEGIFYTSTSGIWQTVWLEPVPEISIDALKLAPDVDAKSLRLHVAANSFSDNVRVETVASIAGKEVARVTGKPNSELVLNFSAPHLWTPDDPFLYDLKVTLRDGDKTLDTVTSYFGLRKIALRKDEQGFTQMALNNEFIFQIGTLDQGFWPAGLYTAPTDAALRSDIEFLKKSGFNLTRKHVKVEPDRWYYWCDKLGLLVWQDMPSGNNATADGRREFENELSRMVEGLEDHPSIIVWVLFNEGWGQYDTETLADWLKKLDPSRLVDSASGWTDLRVGDMNDMHNYPGPNMPAPEPRRASVLGETGGFGLVVTNHVLTPHSWGYVMLNDRAELAARYTQSLKQLWRLHNLRGLSAVIYTQTSDVETECNGLLTYDRAVEKIDSAVLAAANAGGIFQPPKKIILPNALFGHPAWKYTIEPPADNWSQAEFDASAWKDGVGGFGSTGTPNIFANTTWSTSDIWLRREFSLAADDLETLSLQVFHDEDMEIYLNGVLAAKAEHFTTDYVDLDILPPAKAALRVGRNTIAVHCQQTGGGQGIDVGLILPQSAKAARVDR